MRDGHADAVVLPESIDDVSEILASANRDGTPVTVSGAGTGTWVGA
jgi:FAD/FMN-containing dehydrogenase